MSTRKLHVSLGQCTDKGRKPVNQDFHGLVAPQEPLLSTKGVAIALADGISSSDVSQIASATSVKGFLDDYFATPEAWSVKTSVHRVLRALNSWLYSQNQYGPYRYNLDRGYVCTFSALVFKSSTAHLFHIGDTRIYRVLGHRLEQLTEDHRLWISSDKSYLSRALGMRDRLEIDYLTFPVETGDTFVLASDGIYVFAEQAFIVDSIRSHQDDLDQAAKVILDEAMARGSDDNLTIQVLRIDQLPDYGIDELHEHASLLPFPPELRPRMKFDGYEIIRELNHSSRSHLYLALDNDTRQQVAIKVPSVDLREDAEYIDRFLLEEWIARRLDNAHLLKHCEQTRKRNYLYIVSEYIDGLSLNQWIIDNPEPELEVVRDIAEQIAKGLYALHRQEMLHQDLRPNNIMLDKTGTVKLIDFGSVRVSGLAEIAPDIQQNCLLGTVQYTAPEYFLGEHGTERSDQYSLGVITYQLLSGQLPYGIKVASVTTRSALHKLRYHSLLHKHPGLPVWVDEAIRKAVHVNPQKRYDEISEFIHDLRHPNPNFQYKNQPPLLERNPIQFWKGLSFILLLVIIYLLTRIQF